MIIQNDLNYIKYYILLPIYNNFIYNMYNVHIIISFFIFLHLNFYKTKFLRIIYINYYPHGFILKYLLFIIFIKNRG